MLRNYYAKFSSNLVRTRTRTTKWNLFFHYSSYGYTVATGVLLVPLYLKFIPVELYGYWLASGNVLSWISMIDPGFSAVIQQKVALSYGSKDLKAVGAYAFTGLAFAIVFVVMMALVGVFVNYNFTAWLGLKNLIYIETLEYTFFITLLGTMMIFASFTLVSVNQGIQSSLGIGLIYMVANFSGILVNIILLTRGFGLTSLGYSLFVNGFIQLAGNFFYLSSRFRAEQVKLVWDSSCFKTVASLISFNFVGKVGNLGYSQIASFIITKVLTPTETVIYRFTLTVPESSKILISRPIVALLPSVMHLLGEGNLSKANQIFFRLIKYLLWASGLVFAGFVCMNSSFISLWTDAKFFGGTILNIVLVLWVVLSSYTSTLSQMMFAYGNIKKNSLVSFAQGCAYICFLLIGLHYFGLIGAGLALLAGELFLPLWYFSYVVFKRMDFERVVVLSLVKEIIAVCSISAFVSLFFLVFGIKAINWITFLAYTILISCIYTILLSLFSKAFKVEMLRFLTLKKFNT